LEDNQLGGYRLHPKKSMRKLFQHIFTLGNFWDGVSHYAATPLIYALSLGFVHGHQSRQEIIWVAPNKNSEVAQDDWHR
jgi:hypothetical protein